MPLGNASSGGPSTPDTSTTVVLQLRIPTPVDSCRAHWPLKRLRSWPSSRGWVAQAELDFRVNCVSAKCHSF